MDVKIITNVGYWDGQNGKGAIYSGLTPGGTYLFAIKMLVSAVETWTYLRKSQVENGLSMGDMKIADNLNTALYTDVESPEFAEGTGQFKSIPSITNGAELPRLITLEAPYTLKGEGVTASDIDKLKSGSSVIPGAGVTDTTTTGTSGALGGLIPSDFGLLFSNPIKFVQDNPLFVAAVVGLIYFFRRKKKKPLWIF